MTDATERLVNLAFLLGAARGSVTANRIRAEIPGYGSEGEQDETAFKRMLERDKKELRAMGLVIESDAEGNYRLDHKATFASEIELDPGEAATLRAVGLALLEDPSFPFANDLRFALAKISSAIREDAPRAVAHISDEEPERQGDLVADLNGAVRARKSIRFEYTNSYGEHKRHHAEPYGLFVRDGRWYLVARDVELDDARVYTVARFGTLEVEPTRPQTPDFERPSGFDVADYIGLPFQYGPVAFDATLGVDANETWRAAVLTGGKGTLEAQPDGSLSWTVTARNRERLLQWVVENGPGISVLRPPDLADELASALDRVAAMHAGERDA